MFLFKTAENFFHFTGSYDAILSCRDLKHPQFWNNCVVWKHLNTRQETSGQNFFLSETYKNQDSQVQKQYGRALSS